ncbi:MAG: hypothetical protein M1820_005258 [Bogoriella megaspora]|nr:MAG: hypothetical protein M1820_005258 [Bogoriella megaspora]
MRTRRQEAKVTKPKIRARRQIHDGSNTTPRKSARQAPNLSTRSIRSALVVKSPSPISPSWSRTRRKGGVRAWWRLPYLTVTGLNRQFFEDLDPPELEKEESSGSEIQVQHSPIKAPEPQLRAASLAKSDHAEEAASPTKRSVSNEAKRESPPDQKDIVLSEPVAVEHQSRSSSVDNDDNEPEPPASFTVTGENSPNPTHQVEEEAREQIERDPSPDQDEAAGITSALTSAAADVEHGSASSRRSSLKARESSIEPALTLEETKIPSVETPVIIVDEELADNDLPLPFQTKLQDVVEDDCEDNADYILKTRFNPMTEPDAFIAALTKLNPQQRPMDVLYAIAENTQATLKLWQDEYLAIDKRTAPHANIPRKPATGARNPIDPETYEDMREAEIYGYTFDPKRIGVQNPFTQRSARGLKGRELRDRRIRDLPDELSEEDTGTGPGRRTRKPTQKVDGGLSGNATPETTKKRGIASVTPETDAGAGPRKRGRRGVSYHDYSLNPRIREMRAGSAMTSTSDDESEVGEDRDDQDGAFGRSGPGRRSSSKRRGRPKGSRTNSQRLEPGVKRGAGRGALWSKKALAPLEPLDESRGGTPSAMEADADVSMDLEEAEGGALRPDSSYPEPQWQNISPPSYGPNREPIPWPPTTKSLMARKPSPLLAKKPKGKHSLAAGGSTAPAGGPLDKAKQQAKSEKRSKSMTLWWAERKKKQAEQNVQRLQPGDRPGPPPPPPRDAPPIAPTAQPLSTQTPTTSRAQPRKYAHPPAPVPAPVTTPLHIHQPHAAPAPGPGPAAGPAPGPGPNFGSRTVAPAPPSMPPSYPAPMAFADQEWAQYYPLREPMRESGAVMAASRALAGRGNVQGNPETRREGLPGVGGYR